MKQRIVMLMVALAAVWLLAAACAPAAQGPQAPVVVAPTAAPAAPVSGSAKIRFSSWATNPHEVWAIKTLVDRFQQQQTGITVTYDIVQ